MHGQSRETIGTNSADEYFDFGKNKSFLDICGHQGNDFQITDEFWKQLNLLTKKVIIILIIATPNTLPKVSKKCPTYNISPIV